MESIRAPFAMSTVASADDLATQAAQIEVVCHEGDIPASVLAAMDELYAHLYASPRYFEAARELQGASFYVARRNGKPLAIVPYKRAAKELTVASEYISLAEAEIERFAACMFGRYPEVRRIVFPKLLAPVPALAYPRHAMVCGEDMIVPLPRTVQEYEAAIGKNTRRNFKRYASALAKAFPSYRYEVFTGQDIRGQDLRDIVELSCMRMRSKNIVPRFNETETGWIIDFAKECGIVGVARIDGKVAAGAIGFRIGENYFMHVIAHHPQYNGFSLGILCYFQTICEGIACGGKRFHLLNGRYGYKYRLLAERFDVIHLDIYRNRLGAMTFLRDMTRKEIRGRIWLFKQWLLHDVERMEGRAYRLLGRAIHSLRKRKRSRGVDDGL
jgi:CelD/BcsL family acetyltransferase involved in cellulose biosynthesis